MDEPDDRAGTAADGARARATSPALLEQVEADLLGGARTLHPRRQVAERTGMAREEARALWRALGFAAVEDDDGIFTDADVEALRAGGSSCARSAASTTTLHARP